MRLLVQLCKQKGIRKVVFSPGSRSAPLVIAFTQCPEIECLVVPDERSAGYFALGMAQRTRETVAIVCTSGTAVLNLSPAVCEAFYQKIPLLILTADRPPEMIDKGENQAIHQKNVFAPHTVASYQLPCEPLQQYEWTSAGDDIFNAIDQTQERGGGPVHINIPLREPLYIYEEESPINFEPMQFPSLKFTLSKAEKKDYQTQWENASRKMIIVGLHDKNDTIENLLQQLGKREDTVVLTEATSNLHSENFITPFEPILAQLLQAKNADLVPEIVVTIGKQIISKKIRQWLKKYPPILHWHVSETNDNWDIFNQKVYTGSLDETDFLTALNDTEIATPTSYKTDWENYSKQSSAKQDLLLSKMPFADFSVMQKLIAQLPQNATVHYGNSTPIRYANLFRHRQDLTVYANRGTSGIDGCVSTAAGAAWTQKTPTVAIVGDVSFFYDSNGLWHNHLSAKFKIIVINNSGGNIFRLIDGPTSVNQFERFFETRHQLTAKHIAGLHGLDYYSCNNELDLTNVLPKFLDAQSKKPSLLEIFTDGTLSAEVYKKYWSEMTELTLET